MKYLCLVYARESGRDALSGPETDALAAESRLCNEALRRSGRCLASEDLGPAASATTVRVRNGRLSLTDGPVAVAGEQLAAFLLIEARDLNDAIRTASELPSARLGSVEVRPVRERP